MHSVYEELSFDYALLSYCCLFTEASNSVVYHTGTVPVCSRSLQHPGNVLKHIFKITWV